MSDDRRASVFLDVEGGRTPPARPRHDRPFHILLLGDFSGAAARVESGGREPVRSRRVVAVDRDHVDEVMALLRPAVRFRIGAETGPEVAIEFAALDDFHPDRLLERVPLLRLLSALREDARSGHVRAPAPAQPPAAGSGQPPAPRGGSLLDQIVDDVAGAAPVGEPRAAPRKDDLHAYISRVVGAHLVASEDPRQNAMVAQIDDTLSAVLRAILHQRDFQALESVWRGVSFLARRLETGPQLKLFLLDISRDELAADLAGDRAVEETFLHRALIDDAAGTVGAEPWAVCAGLFTFGALPADTELLARIAAVASRANAPFIAAAAASLVGLDSFASEPEPGDVAPVADETWQALRRSAAARFIGLVQPRFLLRAPYHPREEPCENIALDELTSPPSHEDYLWGNGALACTLLLGEAFVQSGWRMRPGEAAEIGSLPLHFYQHGAAVIAKPCAEALLTDRVALRLLDAGVTPLQSMKNGDVVRVAGFQSIAQPPAPIAGAWD